MLLRGPGTRSERPRLQLGLSELSDPPVMMLAPHCSMDGTLQGWWRWESPCSVPMAVTKMRHALSCSQQGN